MTDELDDLLLDAIEEQEGAAEQDAEGRLADALRVWREQTQAVEDAEAALKLAKTRLYKTETESLPSLLDELGVSSVALQDGTKIEKSVEYEAAVAKRMREVVAWLRENGHEGLIKRNVSIAFGKGEDAEAEALLKLLQEQHIAQPVEDAQNVHATTFKALMKELLEEGKVSVETAAQLGVTTWARVKVTLPKTKTKTTRG